MLVEQVEQIFAAAGRAYPQDRRRDVAVDYRYSSARPEKLGVFFSCYGPSLSTSTTVTSAPLKPSREIARLIDIMAALRTPVTGCPWDLEQNFRTIAPYTIEEAYEVADAVARDDLDDLREELGDLLLQVVYHARLAQEQNAFDFGDVVEAITQKLIRRHPHVFADAQGKTAAAVKGLWERVKAEEKRDKGKSTTGALADVSVTLPALTRALKLQNKASVVGFDWNDPRAVLAKIREEVDEIEAALDASSETDAGAEAGDLLFAVVNLARHLGANPESVLRATNLKFERRFTSIERALTKQGRTPKDASLTEMDALWNAAKAAKKSTEKM
jgi:ATP diphosphatase